MGVVTGGNLNSLLSRRHNERVRIIVHGGAGNIPQDNSDLYSIGVRKAAKAGLDVLESGGKALDAVEAAVEYMEDDPTFDAGRGSVLNREGFIEMDAIIVDGASLGIGSIAGVRKVKNPIKLARIIMEKTDHNMFIGEYADNLAEKFGLQLEDLAYFLTERRKSEWEKMKEGKLDPIKKALYSTVGAVALDLDGNLAAATSTGGIPFKMPGRVGDTPLVGCGAYADNELGAASATGLGEAIMKVVLSKTALEYIGLEGDPMKAAVRAIKLMESRVGGGAGLIVLDPGGDVGIAYNTPRMAFAYNEGDRIIHGVDISDRRSYVIH